MEKLYLFNHGHMGKTDSKHEQIRHVLYSAHIFAA